MTSTCTSNDTIVWFQGDSKTFRVTVHERGTSIPVDITGWPIAAEVWDGSGNEIRKATANITGGSDSQILIIDATAGIFEIYFDKGDTDGYSASGYIEVAEYSNSGKETIYKTSINFKVPKLNGVIIP